MASCCLVETWRILISQISAVCEKPVLSNGCMAHDLPERSSGRVAMLGPRPH